MKQRSLKTKLLLLTMGLFLSSGLAMTLMQSSSLQSLRSDIMAQTRSALEQEVSRTLQFQAERYAVQIGALLQQSYQVPLGIAAQLEGSRRAGSAPFMPNLKPMARMPAGSPAHPTQCPIRAVWRSTSSGIRVARSRNSKWTLPPARPNTTPRSTNSAFATANGTCAAGILVAPA